MYSENVPAYRSVGYCPEIEASPTELDTVHTLLKRSIAMGKKLGQDDIIIVLDQAIYGGWLGRVMVLGSFQCRDVVLLWHMVGQGPAVLAAGAGRVGCYFIVFISFILSSFSNASSLWRRLDILK